MSREKKYFQMIQFPKIKYQSDSYMLESIGGLNCRDANISKSDLYRFDLKLDITLPNGHWYMCDYKRGIVLASWWSAFRLKAMFHVEQCVQEATRELVDQGKISKAWL